MTWFLILNFTSLLLFSLDRNRLSYISYTYKNIYNFLYRFFLFLSKLFNATKQFTLIIINLFPLLLHVWWTSLACDCCVCIMCNPCHLHFCLSISIYTVCPYLTIAYIWFCICGWDYRNKHFATRCLFIALHLDTLKHTHTCKHEWMQTLTCSWV